MPEVASRRQHSARRAPQRPVAIQHRHPNMDLDVWWRRNWPRRADRRLRFATGSGAGFYPGSRWGSSGWSDSNGNLWFFGGWGYASSLAQSTGFLDDIWEYHTTGINKGLWTWWKGSSNVNEAGQYPTYLPVQYGVPFVNIQPGARRGVALWQQDSHRQCLDVRRPSLRLDRSQRLHGRNMDILAVSLLNGHQRG